MALKGKPFAKILDVLRGVAPTAVAALGGPYGALAAGVIRKVLNVEKTDDASLEAAVLAAAGDPSAVVKLKEIEAAMQAQEAQLDIRFEEIESEDRASARAREVAVKDWTPRILAYSIIGAAIAIGAAVVFGYAANAESTVAGAVIGYLFGEAKQVMSYYFGSSAGSARKTDMLGKQ